MSRALPLPTTSREADFTVLTLNGDGSVRGAPTAAAPGFAQQVGGSNIVATAVTVGTTATLLAAARSGRNSIQVQQMGTTVVNLGPVGVTTAAGFPLIGTVGAVQTFTLSGALYGIVGTGTQEVRVVEIY